MGKPEAAPRGVPKSGRVWKTPQTKRHSAKKATVKRLTWAQKEEKRRELAAVLERTRELKQAAADEKRVRGRRRDRKKNRMNE